MARRTETSKRFARRALVVVSMSSSLVACRGVLGLTDGETVDATEAGSSPAEAGSVATDGATTIDAGVSDTAVVTDAADAGCPTCSDGGCKVDQDCADPLHERCSNGMWSTAPTFVCIPRSVWGTLHADLPTGTVDFTEQYYGDVTHQTGSMLVRVQVDKGYTVYSVTVADDAPTNSAVPFASNLTTNIFVSFADDTLGASKGGWNGAGTLTLTANGSAKGDRIAGMFTGTLTQLGTAQTAAFHGEIGVTVP